MPASTPMRRLIVTALVLGLVATHLILAFGIEGEQDHPPPPPDFREKFLFWPFIFTSWFASNWTPPVFAMVSLLYAAQNLALFLAVRAALAWWRRWFRQSAAAPSVPEAARWAQLIVFVALWPLISVITGLESWLSAGAAAAVLYICRSTAAAATTAQAAKDGISNEGEGDDAKA